VKYLKSSSKVISKNLEELMIIEENLMMTMSKNLKLDLKERATGS
jgi:hypothetical protein